MSHIINKPRVYDGASVSDMVASFKDAFLTSKTLKKHINPAVFSDATVQGYGSYLEQQLVYVIKEVFGRVYPEMPALEIFPISNEGAIEKILMRRMKTYSGGHTRTNENKSDPNKGIITVSYDGTGQIIEDFEADSSYTETDLARAAQMNDPLDSSLMEAHDMSYKTTIDGAAFLGLRDEEGNTINEGLLNNSQVHPDLEDNASTFTGMDGVTMYKAVKEMWAKHTGVLGGVQSMWPKMLVSSPRIVSLLFSTTFGTNSSDYQNPLSVAEMIKKNLGMEIRATNRAAGLDTGIGGGDRLCMFNNDPRFIKLYIPKPLTFSEVSKVKFRYEFASMFRVAGVAINQQKIFSYLKGC